MRYKRMLNAILVMGLLVPIITLKVSANDYSVTQRIHGNNRVETSIEASKKFYAAGSTKDVVLAGYNGEVDALTGTLLAASMDAPLLLVANFSQIEEELIRLGAKNIYLLGGTSAISEEIENDLRIAGYEVHRVNGENRLETAVAVAKETKGKTNQIFLTNDGRSGSLVDALAVGPVSGMYLIPIMLTAKDKVPEITLKAMKEMEVDTVHIIGGQNVVSKKTELFLKNEGFEVKRIAGGNRYQTAEKIADLYFSPGAAIVANDGHSGKLADALLSGHVGAKMHIPLVLTGTNSLNKNTEEYLLKSSHLRYVLGGESVISKAVYKQIVKTEGETISVDTEEQIQEAHYQFVHSDTVPKNKEMIEEFAVNGKSITTYKSVLLGEEIIKNIRVSSRWVTPVKNGLIYIGMGSKLMEDATPFTPYVDLFNQSGWTTDDFVIQEGRIEGFSAVGKEKAKNKYQGLLLMLPETDHLGEPIQTVGKEAFKNFYFSRVKMPDTIKNIQEGAFNNVNLTFTEFPSQLETIGDRAFSGNAFSNRLDFTALQSLTEIGNEAFNFAFYGEGPYSINLESLTSLKTIGKGAFAGNQIQFVIFPEGLTSIDSDAFIYNLIDEVQLPTSLEYLDELAFDDEVELIGLKGQ